MFPSQQLLEPDRDSIFLNVKSEQITNGGCGPPQILDDQQSSNHRVSD
jgi:hypothetical protein